MTKRVIVIMDEQRSIPHAKLIPNGNFDKNSLEKFAYRWMSQQIREQHLNFNPYYHVIVSENAKWVKNIKNVYHLD